MAHCDRQYGPPDNEHVLSVPKLSFAKGASPIARDCDRLL